MPVHPQVQEILDATAGLPSPDGVEEMREHYAAGCLTYAGQAEPVELVDDIDADGIHLRVYVPKDPSEEPLPLMLWMHGGGWVLGTIESHDALCRALCNATQAVVASVDYRLAPEHPFPGPIEDCETALAWARAHHEDLGIDPERIAVGGDSAGANLATVVARRARDSGEAVQFEALVYPVTDAALATASMNELGDGSYGLSKDEMTSSWEAYVPEARQRRNPDASPLRSPDLEGMPPTLVICAEFDPLKDEAQDYAQRLEDAGVTVRCTEYSGMVHGFFRWRGGVDAAHDAMAELAASFRAVLCPAEAPLK